MMSGLHDVREQLIEHGVATRDVLRQTNIAEAIKNKKCLHPSNEDVVGK